MNGSGGLYVLDQSDASRTYICTASGHTGGELNGLAWVPEPPGVLQALVALAVAAAVAALRRSRR